jgi:hypothetical protein
MHQQVFDHIKWLHELIFNDSGVSKMSATSQKPKGIESGIAIQTMLDVETQRFSDMQKKWEQCAVTAAKICVALAKECFEGGKTEYAVKYSNGRYTESIKWSEVAMPEDEYTLKVWPINLLPSTPGGKIDRVMDLLKGGLIDPLTGMMLLDFPDLEAHQAMALAALRHNLWVIDQVIYERNYIEPREWQDLNGGIKFMQMAACMAQMEGAPEEVFSDINKWIMQAHDLLNPPTATNDPMAMAGQLQQMPAPDPSLDPGAQAMPEMPVDPSAMGGMPPLPGV